MLSPHPHGSFRIYNARVSSTASYCCAARQVPARGLDLDTCWIRLPGPLLQACHFQVALKWQMSANAALSTLIPAPRPYNALIGKSKGMAITACHSDDVRFNSQGLAEHDGGQLKFFLSEVSIVIMECPRVIVNKDAPTDAYNYGMLNPDRHVEDDFASVLERQEHIYPAGEASGIFNGQTQIHHLCTAILSHPLRCNSSFRC
mmetsp:Transcript_126399/g.218131  ORF Transcript_126399/g.218131 Transcript_126399/m.218131 type:complete len:203 (-) Transcript_126399:98-706(-)